MFETEKRFFGSGLKSSSARPIGILHQPSKDMKRFLGAPALYSPECVEGIVLRTSPVGGSRTVVARHRRYPTPRGAPDYASKTLSSTRRIASTTTSVDPAG
jgi:hypothetical protein